MNLLESQFVETKEISDFLNVPILVVVVGKYNIKIAMQSLQQQIYRNFSVCNIEFNALEGKKFIEQVEVEVKKSSAEYIYFLQEEDTLTPNALLEYARYLNGIKSAVLYADECIYDYENDKVIRYELKPKSSQIAYYQGMYLGRAVIFAREELLQVIGEIEYNRSLEAILYEMFLRILLCVEKVANIPLILLKKRYGFYNGEVTKKMLPLLQKCIEKNTKWEGRISKSTGYNMYAYEMQQKQAYSSVEFIVMENELKATKQLLAQLRVSYAQNQILIIVNENDIDEIEKVCTEFGLKRIKVIEKQRSLSKTLEKLILMFTCNVQILLNDDVQWLNRMNVERLLSSFYKPEVQVAVPQIATEGESPKLVYAGGDINSMTLNGVWYRGREQSIQDKNDLAWLNQKITMLDPYCIAIRKDVWNKILPIHDSIVTLRQFSIELSFLCMKYEMCCEYIAQSAFWVKDEIKDYYIRNKKKNKENNKKENIINLGDCKNEIRLSGNYWHLLSEYGELVENCSLQIPDVVRSYLTHLKGDFKAFHVDSIKETGKKRVLVFTHELSLTGAPLVLVQAVAVLQKLDYDILVVSPEDGPLRETYCNMNVPLMIEPQLYENFEYIRVAYDFDFVIANTIVVWPIVEALGQTDIPVLWWVHDSNMGYENYLRYVLPEKINANIHLYCVSDYAQRVIKKYRPEYESKIWLYGLEDFSKDIKGHYERSYWKLPDDKIVFTNIGQIISRKGQDVLLEAIRLLPEDKLKECVFVFIGSVIDRELYNKIENLMYKYPENIRYIERMPHEEIEAFLGVVDCVVCSSTDDPLPTFITEGLVMSRICICSRNTGFNSIISSGQNGYLFESGNVNELYEAISNIIREKGSLVDMQRSARKLYENTFTCDIFEQNMQSIIAELTDVE